MFSPALEVDMCTSAQRNHIRELLDWHWAHRASWDYPPGDQRTNRDNFSWAQTETQLEHYVLGGNRPMMDCSEFGSWVLKSVGLWHHSVPGYTGSHLADPAMHHYTDAKYALPGALFVFGPGTGHHEAVCYHADPKDGNPVLQSHGRPGMDRPTFRDLLAEQTSMGHPGYRILSISKL